MRAPFQSTSSQRSAALLLLERIPVIGLLVASLLVAGLVIAGLSGCGSAARKELHAEALAEAHQLAPARLNGAVIEADEAVLDALRARLDDEVYPLWAAERRLHTWFAGCLERLGAVGQHDASAVDACVANQADLADALQTLRATRPTLAELGDSLATMEEFLEAATAYLQTALSKTTTKTHARYAEMVDAHNRWVEATTVRRSKIIQTLPSVLADTEAAGTEAASTEVEAPPQ